MNKNIQLERLERIESKGPLGFIVINGIIYYGSIVLVIQLLTRIFISEKELTTQFYLISLTISVVFGLIYGLTMWPKLMRKLKRLRKS